MSWPRDWACQLNKANEKEEDESTTVSVQIVHLLIHLSLSRAYQRIISLAIRANVLLHQSKTRGLVLKMALDS